MTISLILIFLDVAFSVAGQLLLKKGMTAVGRIDSDFFAQPLLGLWRMFTTSPYVVLGLGLYVVGAVLWLIVLSRVNLSYAYPLIALTYVLIPLAAWLLLHEPPIPLIRWVGMAIIVFGVVLVARS